MLGAASALRQHVGTWYSGEDAATHTELLRACEGCLVTEEVVPGQCATCPCLRVAVGD